MRASCVTGFQPPQRCGHMHGDGSGAIAVAGTEVPYARGRERNRRRESVEAQLERARLLGIVRDSWAVGFYHPAVVPAEELGPLVSGLQRQGYTFADLRALPTEVRSDYRPDRLARFITWWKVDLSLGVAQIDARLTSQLGWWPTVRRTRGRRCPARGRSYR